MNTTQKLLNKICPNCEGEMEGESEVTCSICHESWKFIPWLYFAAFKRIIKGENI